MTIPTPPVPDRLVALAHHMAETSGARLRRYFRTPLAVDDKADASPVTIADRETESALRDILRQTVPDHGIIGEEYGAENPTAEWVWVLDPIDGTKAFITGKPSFGTLIGLAWQGQPMLGVIDQPITGERWIGGRGVPALLNGHPIRVRPCADLQQACLYATDPDMFCGTEKTAWQRLERAVKLRRFGADCYAYGLLAAGFVDLVYECQLKVHDHLPVTAVIEAAGGLVTDRSGHPLGFASNTCVLAAGDRRAHGQALAVLNAE
ncbi:MAG: Histidinol-phosphate phosphatase putative inositol monophosphatase [Rhodospirillaceae bacterium]|nr:MAG: Histidinol-phosphate phosphatase putative inositol monophosphatase [Rhodospirillaceae bacterium]